MQIRLALCCATAFGSVPGDSAILAMPLSRNSCSPSSKAIQMQAMLWEWVGYTSAAVLVTTVGLLGEKQALLVQGGEGKVKPVVIRDRERDAGNKRLVETADVTHLAMNTNPYVAAK